MENREKDRVSQRTTPTEAGDINRKTSERVGREQNSGTSAEFGEKIGRSEHLDEGGSMDNNRNRKLNEDLSNKNLDNESGRRSSGSESYGSSSGRTGSSSSDISSDRSSSKSGSMESGNVDRSRQDEH